MEPATYATHTVEFAQSERIGQLRGVLNELQLEARDVFASSGESVDRFLHERRQEALYELGASA